MPRLLPLLLLGAVAHLGAAYSLGFIRLAPSRVWGNPAVLYPLIVFLLLACHACWAPYHSPTSGGRQAEVRGFWSGVGLFFMVASISTMQNLRGFVGKVVPGLSRRPFYEPYPLLVAMIAGAWFVGLALWRPRG